MREKKKERDDEIGLFQRLSRLWCTQRYICKCACELLGSVILSVCLVWGFVASLAIILLVQ